MKETGEQWRARMMRETEGMTKPGDIMAHMKADYDKNGLPPKANEGWASPGNSRSFHYFADSKSLCRNRAYRGADFEGAPSYPPQPTCKSCLREYNSPSRCGGRLAYEVLGAPGGTRVYREVAGETLYRFRCKKCGHEGESGGVARYCRRMLPARSAAHG